MIKLYSPVFPAIATLVLGVCLSSVSGRPAMVLNYSTDDMSLRQEGSPGREVTGSYSWTSPEGSKYYVNYIADAEGYRVLESNAVPVSSTGMLADGNQARLLILRRRISSPQDVSLSSEVETIIPEQDLAAFVDTTFTTVRPVMSVRKIVKKIIKPVVRTTSRGRSLDSVTITVATTPKIQTETKESASATATQNVIPRTSTTMAPETATPRNSETPAAETSTDVEEENMIQTFAEMMKLGFGQLSFKNPAVPEASQVSAISEVPQEPAVPEMNQVSTVSELPQEPNVPEISQEPAVTAANQVPIVSEVTKETVAEEAEEPVPAPEPDTEHQSSTDNKIAEENVNESEIANTVDAIVANTVDAIVANTVDAIVAKTVDAIVESENLVDSIGTVAEAETIDAMETVELEKIA